jgi:phospholipid-binding lipoprotein MlaA
MKFGLKVISTAVLSLAMVVPALAEDIPAQENTLLEPNPAPDTRSAKDENDPIEGFNRAMFSFNNGLDEYVLEPVAKGYDYAFPTPVKKGVNNFFENLGFPLYFVSDVLQLKFTQAAEHTGRFLINTTAGVAGFIDVAKEVGLERHYEDVGIALGDWGVDEGAYLVLPFLGPSNVRDGLSRIPQTFLNPIYYIDNVPVTTGLFVVDTVDTRRTLIDAIDAGKKGSLDYYSFVRNSYRQRRLALIYDGNIPKEAQSEPADPLDDPDVSK